jgi:hypothetical protein
MEQLTIAAGQYAKKLKGSSLFSKGQILGRDEGFKAGAEWQKEQYKPILELLKGIAQWAGNLPDNKLITATGPKDAALRGGIITDMRAIAVEAIRKIEPNYSPFEGYKHEPLQD